MRRYVVIPDAAKDIESFRLYLLEKNGEIVASAFLKHIYQKFPLLVAFPQIGKHRTDLFEGLYSFPDKRYQRTIFYTTADYGIKVIAVFGGRQDHK